jgi:hypothetical protein
MQEVSLTAGIFIICGDLHSHIKFCFQQLNFILFPHLPHLLGSSLTAFQRAVLILCSDTGPLAGARLRKLAACPAAQIASNCSSQVLTVLCQPVRCHLWAFAGTSTWAACSACKLARCPLSFPVAPAPPLGVDLVFRFWYLHV